MKGITKVQTIKESVSAEITEKKSKFICNLYYVATVKEAEEKLEKIHKKYHDAKHHCFAYRILEENEDMVNQNNKTLAQKENSFQSKITERASDDGEPSGTAGGPMLKLLNKNELVNVIAIVTRYFGGILLGTGGLVRAYSEAVSSSLEKAEIVTLEQAEKLKIPVSYQNLSYLQYYCKKNNINIIETNFENVPYAIIEVAVHEKDKILYEIGERQFNIEKIEIVGKSYLQTKR